RLDEQQNQATTLHEHLQSTRATAIAKADEVTQLQQVITNQAAEATNSSNPLAEMFKNPEMKELVHNQQKAFLAPMIEKNYAALFSGLRLSPEQSSTLKDMLVKKMMVGASLGVSMLGGETDTDKKADL